MGEIVHLFTISVNCGPAIEIRAEPLNSDGGTANQREMLERCGVVS